MLCAVKSKEEVSSLTESKCKDQISLKRRAGGGVGGVYHKNSKLSGDNDSAIMILQGGKLYLC